MTINKFIQWGFEALLLLLLSLGVGALKDVSHSVNELNVKIGVIVEKQGTQQLKIEDHESRLRYIEMKR